MQNAQHANKLIQFVTFIIEAYNEFQQTTNKNINMSRN